MKFVAEQKLLAEWLQQAAAVADAKSPAQAFQCVKLDAGQDGLSLSATNNLFNLTTGDLPLLGMEKSGTTSTPAERFAKLVATLRPGTPIEISHEAGSPILRVKSGRTNTQLPAVDIQALPVFAETFPVAQLRMSAAELDRALAFTAPAMSVHSDKASLWGVAFNYDNEAAKVYAAACDGTIGAVCCLDTTDPAHFPTVLLPKPLAEKLRALLKGNSDEVAITLVSRAVRFVTPAWTVTSKVVDAVPPPHRRWMAAPVEKPVTIESAELAAIVTRLAAATDMENAKLKQHGARVSFTDQALQVQDGLRIFEDVMAADFDGEPSEIGANILHLGQALSAIGAEEVELHIFDRDSPVRICAKGETEDAFITVPYRI